MIINYFTATKDGDIIVFEKKLLFSKNPTMTFVDSTSGETIDNYFIKNFCYALDGVHFNSWRSLDQSNLNILSSLLTQDNKKIWLQFQYVYTISPSGVNGLSLTVNSATLNGNNLLKNYNYQLTNTTIFGKYVNDSLTYKMTINLAEKLYDSGIVPEFFDRKSETFSLSTDEDYIDFWTSVAHFYSLFYVYALRFTTIYYNDLLCEFLKEKNIFFCNCSDQFTLQLLAKNYYSEIKARGTIEIFRKKGFEYKVGYRWRYTVPVGYIIDNTTGVMIDGIVYFLGKLEVGGDFNSDFNIDFSIGIEANTPPSNLPFGWYYDSVNGYLYSPDKNYHTVYFYNSTTHSYTTSGAKTLSSPTNKSGIKKLYNGEFLRLICYDDCNEFIYLVRPIKNCGWNLNNSSPMYRGLSKIYNDSIIKAFENTFDFKDLTNYQALPGGIGTIVTQNISYLDKTFLNASTLRLTTNKGFGFQGVADDIKYSTLCSPDIDYEVSFWFKQNSTDASFSLKIQSSNCLNSSTQNLIDVKTGLVESFLIKDSTRVVSEANRWYFARFIIYNSSKTIDVGKQPKTSLAAGTNLIMNVATSRLYFKLLCTANTVDLWNFKVKPAKTNNSQCFLDKANILNIFMKNNNKNLSISDVKKKAGRYLLPYNFPEPLINTLLH